MSFTGNIDRNFAPDLPYIGVSSVICGLGLFGNLVAIFVIVVLKEYQKSVTHWYVLQLAIADTIFLATWPFKLRSQYVSRWPFPEWMCKANETILFLNYYSSVMFLVVMSIDRYIAVCRSFSPTLQKLRKRTSAFIIATSVWAIALALTIPIMIHSFKVGFHPFCQCSYEFDKAAADKAANCHSQDYRNDEDLFECLNQTRSSGKNAIDNGEIHCTQFSAKDLSGFLFSLGDYDPDDILNIDFSSGDFKSSGDGNETAAVRNVLNPDCNYIHHPIGWKIFLGFNFLVMFVSPFFIMLVTYGLIVHRLFATRMRATSTSSSASFTHSTISSGGSTKKRRKSSARSDKDRRRVTIMCATLVLSFMACWIPFHTIHLLKFEGLANRTNDYCNWLQRIGTVFAYLSAAINPYLYSFLGTHFVTRWKFATRTVSKSMRRRFSSSSGGGVGSVRYAQRKPGRENSTSNNPTLMTKINKIDNNVSESKPMTFTGTNYTSELGQTNVTKDNSSEGAAAGTPPPDYEHSLTMNEDKSENVFKD